MHISKRVHQDISFLCMTFLFRIADKISGVFRISQAAGIAQIKITRCDPIMKFCFSANLIRHYRTPVGKAPSSSLAPFCMKCIRRRTLLNFGAINARKKMHYAPNFWSHIAFLRSEFTCSLRMLCIKKSFGLRSLALKSLFYAPTLTASRFLLHFPKKPWLSPYTPIKMFFKVQLFAPDTIPRELRSSLHIAIMSWLQSGSDSHHRGHTLQRELELQIPWLRFKIFCGTARGLQSLDSVMRDERSRRQIWERPDCGVLRQQIAAEILSCMTILKAMKAL